MVTREIELTKEQNRLLEEIAAEPNLASLKRRAAALSGLFRSGLQNLSTEHDRYVAESFGIDRSRPG